jgi:glutamate formiminotransferase/formiminotetrahydrofolate cyclodeaminase
MNLPIQLLECVPNFSEGRNPKIIQAIAAQIRNTPGVCLLHIDISPAANRTVMTFAGVPEVVVQAAFLAIRKAAQLIDMRTQQGVHPRIGATDVCPLVPLRGMNMAEAVTWSQKLGARVGGQLQIPVYLYEFSAAQPYRRALPDIRKGQYEGMAAKMQSESWKPDYGPASFNARTGAAVIGVRDILVAFNISLDTQDAQKACHIADRIRTRGYIRTENGKPLRVAGLLPRLRAMGWHMADFDCAQVSMNLLDYRITSPLQVWETCKKLAAEIGVKLIGSELIGLIPESCLLEAGRFAWGDAAPQTTDTAACLAAGIQHLGLDKVKPPFDPQEKVLEYALQRAGLA